MEVYLLASLLIFGSIMIFLTPIGGGYDEDQHLARVWQMSDFVMIPKKMPAKVAKYPEIFNELSYRQKPLVEPIPSSFWKDNADIKLFDRGYHYGPTWTRSGYSPVLLFPQAMAMRYLGRNLDLSVLFVYYGTRFAGLLSYMALTWLALRLIPYSKWLFLLLMLSPMAIYQAATISADTISNGLGFLFIAGVLALNEKRELDGKATFYLTLLVITLFATKLNLAPLALMPFILISPRRFQKKYLHVLLVIFSIIFFLLEVIGWSFVTLSSVRFVVSEEVDFSGQLLYIFTNPFAFLKVVITDPVIHFVSYITQWIGVYGYDYGNVPLLAYAAYLLAVGHALFQNKTERRPDKRIRIILFVFFFLIYLFTISIFYVTVTAVGEGFVYGMQGRYFTTIAPLLLLGTSGLFTTSSTTKPFFQMALYSAAPIIYIAGLFLNFHIVCGSTYYSEGLCYQPVYKNYSPLLRSTVTVTKEITLNQEIKPVCDGMTLIQARINSIETRQDGQTEFIVRDENQNTIVFQEIVQNRLLLEDSWHALDFPPEWKSSEKLYSVSIHGVDTEFDNGPIFAYSLRPEYPDGNLYINGNPVDDDIIFQYACITGLENLIKQEE